MIVYELFSGKRPFADTHPEKVPDLVIKGQRPAIPATVHYTIAALIAGCWHHGMCNDDVNQVS